MPAVFEEIVRQRAAGDTSIIGAMLESNLVAGAQKFPQPLDQLVYGQSITDACIDWDTTERLILEAREKLNRSEVKWRGSPLFLENPGNSLRGNLS